MIDSIKIENFQSHKDTTISFDKGMNVLIGQSDSGKTSVLRALLWVITNRPGGDEFRSHWGGDTRVTVNYADGNTLIREKGKGGRNAYILNGKEYVAFGQDVPDDIKKVVNMNNINIQRQMDSPFLLSETPGNVAAHFNKVANLELIDQATSFINKRINSISSEIKRYEKNIAEKSQQLDRLPDIAAYEKEVNKYEELISKRESIQSKKLSLEITAGKLEKVEPLKKIREKRIKTEVCVDYALSLYAKKKAAESEKDKLVRLVKRGVLLRRRKQELPNMDDFVCRRIDKMLQLYQTRRDKALSAENLQKICKRIQGKVNERNNALERLNDLEHEYAEIFPEECPLCGTILDDKENGKKKKTNS